MLSSLRERIVRKRPSIFKFKKDSKAPQSYEDMDEEEIEKAFRELLV
jgi:hypothetical protein